MRLVFTDAYLTNNGTWDWAGFKKDLELERVRREARAEMSDERVAVGWGWTDW